MTSTRATTPQKDNGKGDDGKVINDPIHGTMYFNPVIVAFIDTPEFQRLRDVKQLGGTSYVYPGGVHTRFDHSLGTCHLAGYVLKSLKEKIKERCSETKHSPKEKPKETCPEITERNILCVEIAALCHDLGHGPLSRVYQDQFLRRLKGVDWGHNEASVKIFEKMVKSEKIMKIFEEKKIADEDIEFIKAAMRGEVPDGKGDVAFLYEIVKNRRNGVDCNMFDTILRDCYFVGIKTSFNYKRFMENVKICKVKTDCQVEERRLCIRFKERLALRELFHSSWTLQTLVHFHKTSRAIEMMIAEALEKADARFHISEARDDPGLLVQLSDCILHRITHDDHQDDEDLKEAKNLLQRVRDRKLYQFCGQTNLEKSPRTPSFVQHPENERQSPARSPTEREGAGNQHVVSMDRKAQFQFCETLAEDVTKMPMKREEIAKEDIFVEIITIKYGNGEKDPLENVDFINKEGTVVRWNPRGRKEGSVKFLNSFKDQYIRVYCRNAEKKGIKQEISNRFYEWCKRNRYDVPEDMERGPIEHDDTEESKPAAARRITFD